MEKFEEKTLIALKFKKDDEIGGYSLRRNVGYTKLKVINGGILFINTLKIGTLNESSYVHLDKFINVFITPKSKGKKTPKSEVFKNLGFEITRRDVYWKGDYSLKIKDGLILYIKVVEDTCKLSLDSENIVFETIGYYKGIENLRGILKFFRTL